MAVDLNSFKANRPEFANAGDALITATLAQVELRVSDSWGDRRDEVVELEAAHALASSPFGRNARLTAKDGTTTYGETLRRMKYGHAWGRGRIG